MLSNNVRRHSLLTGTSAPGSILQNSFIRTTTCQTRRKVLTFGFVHWHVEIQNFVSHDLTKVLSQTLFIFYLLTLQSYLKLEGHVILLPSVHLRLHYNTVVQGFTVFQIQWHMCFYMFEGPSFFEKKGILRRWSLLYALKAMQKAASIPSFVPKFNAFKSFKRLS